MKTNTIIAIEELHEKISSELLVYRKYHIEQGTNMDDPIYGSEKEYSINTIIYTVQNLLSDLAYLIHAHNVFLSLFTYNERINIKGHLNQIYNHLHNRNHHYVVPELEALKSLVRVWNIRIDKRKLEAYNEEIERIKHIKTSLNDDINDIKSLLEQVNSVYSGIQEYKIGVNNSIAELSRQQEGLKNLLMDEEAELSKVKEYVNKSRTNEQVISQNLENANRSKKTFDEFIAKISEREIQLKKQEDDTNKYHEVLKNFSSDYTLAMEETRMLIEEAKKALNYKNAEGLSAAFSTQLSEAKSKSNTRGWLIGAIVFLLFTLFVGIWIITGWWIDPSTSTENQMLLNLIGRLSMIPFTITGAIFCANQYTKQKNLIEDYAYKTTIAKSIIAFSEELRTKDPERYAEYISTVLKEIHQDPLRKRGKNSDEFSLDKESTGLIEKLIATLHSSLSSK